MKQFWLDTSKMTDGELVDLLCELNNELGIRLRQYKGLRGQCEAAALRVRSWSTLHQINLKGNFIR